MTLGRLSELKEALPYGTGLAVNWGRREAKIEIACNARRNGVHE